MHRMVGRTALALCALSLALVPLGVRVAAADTVVNANHPVIVSNDITNQATDVVSLSGGLGNGNAATCGDGSDGTSCSGLGDATNPSDAGVTNNTADGTAGGDGTDNPSLARKK